MRLFKKRYVVIYLIKEHGTYSVLKKKRIKPTKNTVKYSKNKSYIIDTSKPTYVKGLRLFYFIEIKKGFLDFEKPEKSASSKKVKNKKGEPETAEIKQLSASFMSPEIVDLIMSQNVVKQIVSGLEGGLGINWMNLITGLSIGCFIGLIVGLFF